MIVVNEEEKTMFFKGRVRCTSRKGIFTSFCIFTPRTCHLLSFTLGQNQSYFIILKELIMIYAGMEKDN